MISNRSKSFPLVKAKRRKPGTQVVKTGPGRSRIYFGNASRNDRFYANDTTAYRPEQWASEAVGILYEEMLYAGLVHRDFSPMIASFGDTVHTRKPGSFSGKRKQNDLDTLVEQDATATNIEVKLNQRVYVSFLLGDADRSLSFQNLTDIYLREAMMAQAQMLDKVIGAQSYQFLGNVAGGLESMTKTNSHDYLLDMRKVFNDNKVGAQGRWLGLASGSETAMQKTEMFKKADEIGDMGRALREATLGKLGGWNTFLELNTPSITGATTATGGTVDGAAIAGASTVDVQTGEGSNFVPGQYCTIVGDMTPLRVATVSTDTLTFTRPLKYPVADNAAITPIATGLINQASAIAAGDTTLAVSDGYPAGWMKEIVVDGTQVPEEGQMVAFRTAAGAVHAAEYGIIEYDSANSTILLDRPLEQAVANNDVANYGPNGDYNFAFQRNALTLVNRPLALPDAGTGARAAIGQLKNMSIRVAISWDSSNEATRVTISGLFGVKVLDSLKGGVLLG